MFRFLLLLPVLVLGSCAPAPARVTVPPSVPVASGCQPGTQPITGIAVQSIFEGDYGSQLGNWLTQKLNDAGFKAFKSSDYPDVNRASINVVGLIDHWTSPKDNQVWRVGNVDLQVTDRQTNSQLARFVRSQGAAVFAPTLPEYVDQLVQEFQRRYCQV